jgi:hypothetical protein
MARSGLKRGGGGLAGHSFLPPLPWMAAKEGLSLACRAVSLPGWLAEVGHPPFLLGEDQ